MDVVTAAKLWLAIRPLRRLKERRARKRGETVSQPDEVSMDFQAFVVQALLAVIRHGLTAGGLTSVVASEQSMAQIAGVLALVVGGVWSLARKWTAAKAKPTA